MKKSLIYTGKNTKLSLESSRPIIVKLTFINYNPLLQKQCEMANFNFNDLEQVT